MDDYDFTGFEKYLRRHYKKSTVTRYVNGLKRQDADSNAFRLSRRRYEDFLDYKREEEYGDVYDLKGFESFLKDEGYGAQMIRDFVRELTDIDSDLKSAGFVKKLYKEFEKRGVSANWGRLLDIVGHYIGTGVIDPIPLKKEELKCGWVK